MGEEFEKNVRADEDVLADEDTQDEEVEAEEYEEEETESGLDKVMDTLGVVFRKIGVFLKGAWKVIKKIFAAIVKGIKWLYRKFDAWIVKTPLGKYNPKLLFTGIWFVVILILTLILAVSCGKKTDAPKKDATKTETVSEESSKTGKTEESSTREVKSNESSEESATENAKGGPLKNATDGESEANSAAPVDHDALTETVHPGILYLIDARNSQHLISGIRMDGSSVGTYGEEGSINGKPFSKDDMRFLFEMNEWIEVSFETSVSEKEDLDVYVFSHHEDSTYYKKTPVDEYEYIGVLESAKSFYGTHRFVEFYINPEDENEPGYYDLVFVYENEPLAMTEIKLVKEGELAGKTDADVVKLMQEELKTYTK